MFSHVVVGSNDLERSRRFYDALFDALGETLAGEDALGRLTYVRGDGLFIVGPPRDGAPATHGNGGTIGFNAGSAARIDRWHAAGLAHGGTNAADPPAERLTPSGAIYLAYLRDPDGNKLAAAFRVPAA